MADHHQNKNTGYPVPTPAGISIKSTRTLLYQGGTILPSFERGVGGDFLSSHFPRMELSN
jgi:hypothetical protein